MLSPVGLLCGVAGLRAGFLVWLGFALVSDTLDGILARRWALVSDRGSQLDSWGDLLTYVFGLAGAVQLWAELGRRELRSVTVIIVAVLVPALLGVVRDGRLLGFHSILARMTAWTMWPGTILMLSGITASVFRIAAIMQGLVAVEYVSIALLRPDLRGPVPSLLHAFRTRLRKSEKKEA